VNFSPFLAIATVNAHVSKYVDDFLTGADTDNSALKLQQEMSDIMMAAAFNLTKWASNSKLVMDGIDPDKRAMSLLVECDSHEPLKALGVSWNLNSDCFRFIAPNESVSSHDPMTKRSLLSLASRMFDPMGLISPFTVRARILFQELWRRGLEWDDPLDSAIKREWSSWKSELLQLKDVTIPPETLLSTLRQRIWITQGRREVKRIIRKCVICQRQRVGPCGQKMGPLPKE